MLESGLHRILTHRCSWYMIEIYAVMIWKLKTHRSAPYTARASSILTPVTIRLAALSAMIVVTAATADTVTNRFVCTVESGFRSVELSYLDEVGSVPCAIRETRQDGSTRLLWRADYDLSLIHI